MIVIVLILWTLSVLFLSSSREKRYMRWAAATTFVGGYGSFGRVLIEDLLPYMKLHSLSTPIIEYVSKWVYVFATLMNITFLPSFFLIFTITYVNSATKNTIKGLILLPSVFTIIYDFLFIPIFPKVQHNYWLIAIWAIPYIVSGFIIVVKQYLSETNISRKQTHAVTVLTCSPVFFQMFSVYISRLLGLMENFRFNALFFALSIPFIIYFFINTGILGIRLKLEKNYLDYSTKAITNGTSVLFHALKNHVVLTQGCINNIRIDYKKSQRNIPDELEIIESSSIHMIGMLKRIQNKTQEIILMKESIILNDLIKDSLYMLSDILQKKHIAIELNASHQVMVICDPVHVQEVITNILENSIDAIEGVNGKIEIYIKKEAGKIVVKIKDNGKGIDSATMKKVFQPFFSTKNFKLNYGLGLTYCYQVIGKHNGLIQIESEPFKGTVVTFQLPLTESVKLFGGLSNAKN